MIKKPSLYEILGVPESAEPSAIEHAWTTKLAALEHAGATGLSPAELASRKQIIRLAASTLLDSSSRFVYDSELARHGKSGLAGSTASSPFSAARPFERSGDGPNDLALIPQTSSTAARDSMNLRADALALRADAMSLRADAMILQTRANLPSSNQLDRSGGWLRSVSSGPILRITAFLVVMCLIALSWARCSNDAPQKRNAAASSSADKAALQEYFQTYGVRPANVAEMELLEAERRRKSNDSRNEQQNVDKKVNAELKFEEDARKRAQDVSDRLRNDEERQKLIVEREEREAERVRNQRKEAERQAEERRIQKLEEKWQQIIRR